MSIQDHSVFDRPADDDPIWRYMDLGRFMSLLQTSSLWMGRVDLFDDPYEGSLGAPNLEVRAALEREYGFPLVGLDNSISRQIYVVNCWHMNDGESAAMWDLYQREGRGIAIRTTVGRLDAALRGSPTVLHLGRVKYVDYSKTHIDERNGFNAVLHKRKSFDHEREVRLVGINFSTGPQRQIEIPGDPATGEEGYVTSYFPLPPPGVLVAVDLPTLIEDIFLAPGTPPWAADVVRTAVAPLGLTNPVRQSSFDADPIF